MRNKGWGEGDSRETKCLFTIHQSAKTLAQKCQLHGIDTLYHQKWPLIRGTRLNIKLSPALIHTYTYTLNHPYGNWDSYQELHDKAIKYGNIIPGHAILEAQAIDGFTVHKQ